MQELHMMVLGPSPQFEVQIVSRGMWELKLRTFPTESYHLTDNCTCPRSSLQFVTRYLLALWAFLTIFIMFTCLFHSEEQSDCSHKVCSCLNPFCFGLVCFSLRGDFVLECSFMFESCKIRMPWIMNCWNWYCRSFACEHNWSCFDKPRRCGKLVLLLIMKKRSICKNQL